MKKALSVIASTVLLVPFTALFLALIFGVAMLVVGWEEIFSQSNPCGPGEPDTNEPLVKLGPGGDFVSDEVWSG